MRIHNFDSALTNISKEVCAAYQYTHNRFLNSGYEDVSVFLNFTIIQLKYLKRK